VAISNDSLESHQRFAEKLGGLPYPLLSDEGNEAINAYGVLNDTQTAARRSIFIVGREGRVGYVNPCTTRGPDTSSPCSTS
jgi:peroxiredoxin